MFFSRAGRARSFGTCALLTGLGCLATSLVGAAQTPTSSQSPAPVAGGKTFIDYFKPIPVKGQLSTTVWGAKTVGPRDPANGLEDPTMTHWDYWDGKILRGKDGRYHMFASRWNQSAGHNGWGESRAVSAVSKTLTGPYIDQGLCWPDNQGGKGHNVTALQMPDGRYAVVVSETRPGDVFISDSLDGPWKQIGSLQVEDGPYKNLAWMSNVSMAVRPSGAFEVVARSGAIWISREGILGPYIVQGPSIYPTVGGLPQDHLGDLEDPTLWYSGGLYHILVNNWFDRKAYHLTSVNGITGWTYRGAAYDPTADFVRFSNGTVDHWNKIERPGVFLDHGHVAAVSMAVIDVAKEDEHGNDGHGSKVIVIPFDGAAMDRDLQKAQKAK